MRLQLGLSLIVLSMCGGVSQAEDAPPKVLLKAAANVDRLTRVTAQLEVGGDLKTQPGGKTTSVPISVQGSLEYDERILEADAKVFTSRRSIRLYNVAEATVKFSSQTIEPALREDRDLIGATVKGGRSILYSPQGPLTTDELDVLDLPGNTLFLDLLLPGEEVAIGQTWKPTDQLVGALLGLENVNKQSLESELTSVKNGAAEVALAGKVTGIVNGVGTEIELKGKYLVDVERGQVAWLTLVIKEKRQPGVIGPGLDVTAKLKMTVAPLAKSDELNDMALADVKLELAAGQTHVEYESDIGGFRAYHDRQWHVTNAKPTSVILRRLDKTDTVAQCSVTALAKLVNDKRDTLAEFQKDVETALGKNFGRISHASQGKTAQGLTVFKTFVTGTIQDVAVEWRYYLLADPQTGRRVAVAFTIEGKCLEQLGTADQDLVEQLELFEPAATAAKAKPTKLK